MTTAFSHSFPRRASCALAAAGVLLAGAAHAAIVPDRTRVIFNEGEQAAIVTITNKSTTYPYLVQSWLEDTKGNRVTTPLMVVPPLQRVEANERNVLRIAKLPGTALPADRESVFYLNIREVPPKSDMPNTLQIALHTQMKLFYRPKAVQPARDEDWTLPMTLRVDAAAHKLVFDNPTPYHVTVVEVTAGAQKTPVPIEPVMVSPMSTADVPFKAATPSTLFVTHIDDYGGQVAVEYACEAGACKSVKK
ncbi:molecular chaperone [Burkholderia territorii]|uniref:fimbrial biogenesis chaperone n=1 Tax=Burkholderia territorii TaxID=1503055 RepID=UPI000757F3F4|nr:molecular chaperone [Burkholderia territorii]KWE37750.1 fimbrial protein [Burkholderia territorii]KWE39581.1 fimbrial protein [Burkholderia territorii]KWE47339.1 fimbrial protein [Burkholderia territorii]KWO62399.1 fimbrial protein [Burkholderia territorii]